ncbi:septum formation protein Maf [Spirosoma sp. BT702]|uniref:dTTP/UTP pyrophosphatase n=1 Tax=Spirosoma profusum TaxID=2771354 RepID=A0A926XUS1_9BACT|nr:Maf family nucleotide pyrophosphatase [Spirosoma profusum]MBD2700838.1 septum formation protein Maf [Spirosoma profusum]
MLSLRYPLILASGSPRRKQLMTDAGFTFIVEIRPTDEVFPDDMPADDVAEYLACQKATQFRHDLDERIVLCADTVVILDGKILNKPQDEADARRMLRALSGQTHRVRTGVCVLAPDGNGNIQQESFTDETQVTFATLTDDEITYYIRECHPFDKAGAYGAQDFIGLVGIEHLEGSFYTVMGLPTHRVYQVLKEFSKSESVNDRAAGAVKE